MPLGVPAMATDVGAVRRRALLVGLALTAALGGLAVRAFGVAVGRHEEMTEKGNRQQLRSYTLDASRGDVVDRGHIALAVNDRVWEIVVNPRLVQAEGAEEQVVRAILEAAPHEDEGYVRDELGKDKAFRRLRGQLADPEAEVLRQRHVPGLRLEPGTRRVYPRKGLGAHLLGRVNREGQGTLGVEYGFDAWLRGRETTSPAFFATGKKLLVGGHPDPGIARGSTVVLTVDSAIQAMAEEALADLVEEWKPAGATAIVLEPATGEILALANRPTFDPNHAVESVDQTVNLAVQAAYEPGSTMKAVTVAAALETGVIRPEETFYCEKGKWQATSEYTIKDTKPSEWLDVTEILAVSSNICTAKIYEKLGKQALYGWVRKFQFGERPDIQLPGATPGLLAPWEKWSDIQAANISFGQGMSASPLQVAAAFATLANGGTYQPPRIVQRVYGHDGEILWEPPARGRRVVRAATARTVLRMLESVVHGDHGTGKNAKVAGYRVAGKTSTAQKAATGGGYAEDLYYASFVGAVPARDPAVVILVSVDEPVGGHYGNEVAAPAFAALAGRVMTHLGVPRDDGTPASAVKGEGSVVLGARAAELLEGFDSGRDLEPELPGRRRSKRVSRRAVPDFAGMTVVEALDLAQAQDLGVRAAGSGIVVAQDPPPGEPTEGSVTLQFEPPV
jgi:cell division protein FtsI (penicillin-binding protein 3)